MTRKKNTGRTKTIAVNSDQLPAPNPEGQAVLDALRSNQNLLGELAARYEVSLRPEGPDEPADRQPLPGHLRHPGARDVRAGSGAAARAVAQHVGRGHRPAGDLSG